VQVGGEPGVWLRVVAIAGSIRKKPGFGERNRGATSMGCGWWGRDYLGFSISKRLTRLSNTYTQALSSSLSAS